MTAVDDLSAWLTQIWDEDEARVREALAPDYAGDRPKFYDVPGGHRDDWGLWTFHVDPASVLARIAADRQILKWCTEREQIWVGGLGDDPSDPKHYVPGALAHPTDSVALRLLASAYADRPGYRAEWAPESSPSQPESEPLP